MTAGQMLAAFVGLAMFVIGAYFAFRSPATIRTEPPGASELFAASQPASQPAACLEPVVFRNDQVLCEIELAPAGNGEQLDRLLEEAVARINGLGDREIVLTAPDADDGMGSLRFNDRAGDVRWIVHWRAIVEDELLVRLVYRVAEPVDVENPIPGQQPCEAFAVGLLEVMEAIRLPLEDAASELNLVIRFPGASALAN